MNFASNATSRAAQFHEIWNRASNSPPDLRSFVESCENLSPGELAAILRIDQRERWSRNEFPIAEDYLAEFPVLRQESEAAIDLIYGEYLLIEARGDNVQLQSFLDRFPEFADVLAAQVQIHRLTADTPSGTAERPTNPAIVNWKSLSTALPNLLGTQDLVFGRYQIQRLLGRGGMGTIYLARDSTLDRLVALKIPHSNALWSSEIESRFFQEARAAAKLNHPNICTVHDAGVIHGQPYLAMEFIEGTTLSESIRQAGRFSQHKSATISWQLASALEIAHQAGVLHRDLKSSNIMLNKLGQPIVTDFGLARLVTGEDPRITTTGKLLGTPAYSSPEQLEGELDQIGPASDVYSLGVILFEMLTGRLPFEGTVATVVKKALTEDPPRISDIRPDVSLPLEEVCLKAMQRSLQARIPTMHAMARALESIIPHLNEAMDDRPTALDAVGRDDRSPRATQGISREGGTSTLAPLKRITVRRRLLPFAILLLAIAASGLALFMQGGWSPWKRDLFVSGSVWEGTFHFDPPMDYFGPAQLKVKSRRGNAISAIYSTEQTYTWEVEGEIKGDNLRFRFLPGSRSEKSPDLANRGLLSGSIHGNRLDLMFHDESDGTSAVVTLKRKTSMESESTSPSPQELPSEIP